MIDLVTGWSKIAQYEDKRSISIVNLVETMWLSRYPRPIEITYDQGKECIGHQFRKYLIEIEYRITAKPSTSGNPMYNAILERIHHVRGNLVRTFNIFTKTYVDKDDPWTVILAAEAFAIRSTTNREKGYSSDQLIFGHDMILSIKHRVDWELIHQQKQMKINRDNTQDNNYKVRDDVMLTNHTAYNY